METTLRSLKETKAFAAKVLDMVRDSKNINGATVVALHGDLGAGKTTLTQSVGALLGVTGQMQSPTFVIQKNYHVKDKDFKEFIHIDAYRIEDPKEFEKIKIEEALMKKDTLIFVEWPKQGGDIFANPQVEVFLEAVDENTRKAIVR